MISMAVMVAACSSIVGDTPVESSPGSVDSSSTSGSTGPAPGCVRFTGDHNTDIDTGSLATDALYLSGEVFLCADDVVVVGEGDINEMAVAAQLAAAVSGPLLFPDPRLSAELGRLKPDRVHLVGNPQVNVPSGAETVTHDIASAADLTQERLGSDQEVTVPAVPDESTIVETVLAVGGGDRVALPQSAPPGSTTVPAEPVIDNAGLVTGLAVASESESIWMVDVAKPATILLASAVGRSLGAAVVAIDGTDILGHPEVSTAIEGRPNETLRFIGGTPAGGVWELALLASNLQVPGGGFHILPTEGDRRYLAYYGHPETTALGVLGEQGPAETRALMEEHVTAYAGDGSQVVPTFEMIASVASAGPTDDNDYSYEWPIETFTSWVDFAAENGMYVMLDLQSGRDPFLSQAVQYEELLKLPFVGLALDPEWRLGPDQVHLQQVGQVQAAEVNEVVNWLADLVRDNGLPQKMLVVHQFRPHMIQNRQDLISRPEIQMIVQMDGDGTEPQKDATWANLLQGAADVHWSWGWKNFFDEDEPGPPSPENTMGKVPSPVYVSYQ
jgi:hypothetical protein